MSSNLTLGVEVVSARELAPPRDGDGTANAFAELHFDSQQSRTTVKDRDLSPVWNEAFRFRVSDPSSLPELRLHALVFHLNRSTGSRSLLGKACISSTSFVSFADAATLYYPLEKRSLFSRARGELGLKVYLTNSSIPAVDPLIQPGAAFNQDPPSLADKTETVARNNSFLHLSREQVAAEPALTFAVKEMKPEPLRAVSVPAFPSASFRQPFDFQLKETNPPLGAGRAFGGRVFPGGRTAGTYDLVERMHYLFVRVVKGRELPPRDVAGSIDPFVEVRLGNYRGTTKHFEKKHNPEWDEVFAFSRESVQSSLVEVVLKDKSLAKDGVVGRVHFDLNEVPMRVPPDSPLAPEWYRLENVRGERIKGELMLAVWIGTQADECFPNALHADSAPVDPILASVHIRGKVYHAPRLWYVRVHVVEAQDVFLSDRSRVGEVFVRAKLGSQVLKTRVAPCRTPPYYRWDEDHLFVAAEPFEEELILSVEDRVGPNKEEVIGHCRVPLAQLERRFDEREVASRWFGLQRHGGGAEAIKEEKFSSKLHLRLCLEGGYHVLSESTHYSSDLRPTAKHLWRDPIGLLELGVLNADGLTPMRTRDGRGTCDPYCVAKYGQKWVRTRTVVDRLSPRFHEQYTWDVHDHATVLTVGVFDNCQLERRPAGAEAVRDAIVGKVRIRLSTLETGRVYTHSYPLLVLHNSGVKKMGELHLAIRFSATSFSDTLYAYSRPLLPRMHYVRPLSMVQQEVLRHQAVQIVALRLSRMEPPLRREVVEHMSDAHAHLWSMRRSKANFFRLMSVFSGVFAVAKWFADVCCWTNPVTTVLVHLLFVMLVCFPELILPTFFLYLFLIGLWNYRRRPRHPPHMNTRISHADVAHPDELDEEFDTFPTSRSPEIVRMRYDRLRSVAGRIQTIVGDVATQGERCQALVSWRDPRATAVFLLFCLCAALVLYVTPFPVVALLPGFYCMRHPRFRNRLPAVPMNFFRRLPARTDCLL
ncbi:FT-interacting protein 1-like isoform X2 [Ananas comosus]|uniref:FT-interacting protein 1-like isoform X2 n=1 Tax=Ananas comosus TaxID=4615 RepID=A0A6P5FAY7_ANACO|nr:FT-interacting protein 1-like isoform X2 [Ananas comosus]